MIRPVRPDRLGIVLVLASSAAFGGNAIFAKLSYNEGATVGEFLSVRFTIAAIVFWLLLRPKVTRRRAGARAAARARVLRPGDVLLLGGLDPGRSVTSVFQAVTPPIVAVAAVLLGREKASARVFVAIGIAGIGMVLVGLTGGDSSGHVVPLGALLSIASSAWYAGYLLAGERIVKNVRPLVLGCLIATGGAIGFTRRQPRDRAVPVRVRQPGVAVVRAVGADLDRVRRDRRDGRHGSAGAVAGRPADDVRDAGDDRLRHDRVRREPVDGAVDRRRAGAGRGGRGAAAERPHRYRFGRMTTTRETIEAAFSGAIPAEDARAAVDEALGLLDRGEARLAEPGPDGWTVNGWLQQAILLHFRLQQMEVIEHGPFTYHDKIPLKGIDAAAGRARRAARHRAPRGVRRGRRGADAELRQHRLLRRVAAR